MKNQIALALSALALTACGSGSGLSQGSIDLGTIGQGSGRVPRLTGTVGGNSSLSMKALNASAVSASSMGVGQTKASQAVQTALSAAGYSDFRACLAEEIIKNKNQDLAGKYFYYRHGSDTYKMKIDLIDGSVQSYENYFCAAGTTQSWAFKMNSANKANVVANLKFISSDSRSQVTATGELAGGVWKHKNIVSKSVSSGGGYTQSERLSFDQREGSGVISQVRETNNPYDTNGSFAIVAQIDFAGSFWKQFIYGDGSAKFEDITAGTPAGMLSWSGGSEAANDSTGLYFNSVSGQSLPVLGTVTVPNFTSDEIWDCSIPSDAVEYDFMDLYTEMNAEFTACDAKY